MVLFYEEFLNLKYFKVRYAAMLRLLYRSD